jgi:hypothetical protein
LYCWVVPGVDICIALGSPCFGKLDTVSKIERHQDTQNGVGSLAGVPTKELA